MVSFQTKICYLPDLCTIMYHIVCNIFTVKTVAAKCANLINYFNELGGFVQLQFEVIIVEFDIILDILMMIFRTAGFL